MPERTTRPDDEGEARPDGAATPRTGRDRPRRLGTQLVMAGLVGALAFAATAQINRDDGPAGYSSLRGVELVELLKSVDAANDRLAGQIDDLTRTRDDLSTARDGSAEVQAAAELRAEQLAILAGSVGAEGPGVRLRLEDPDGVVDAGVLLDAVEELRNAGAEVIVVNESARVVAQTYFLDEEGGVRVGGRAVEAPYVLEAIGDPATLSEALTFRGGLVDRVEGRGAQADVETLERLTITALADVKSPEYARPSIDGDEGPVAP